MPNPTSNDLRHDKLLTNISISYANQRYVADQVFPVVPVSDQAGLIPTYDQSHWFRDAAVLRAPGTKSRRGGFSVGTDTYYAPRYSFGFELPDEVRATAGSNGMNLDRDATNFVTEKGYLRREVAFAADFFTTGVWGAADKTGNVDFTYWNDYATGTPLINLTDYADIIDSAIGREPNTLLLGKQAWLALKWHPDLIDSIKYTQRGVMSTDIFGSMIDIPKVLIGRALRVSSAEGVAESSATYVRIFGKAALLMWVPEGPSLMAPASGYTFVWNRVPNALQYIKRMRDEESEVDVIEMNTYFDQKQTSRSAGLFMTAVIP
jgi:hypothetical protein